MKNSLILILALFMTAFGMSQNSLSEKAAVHFKTGNSKELAKHFGSNVDLSVKDKEEVYSKAQAELIVKDFFAKHTPTGFKIVHRGTSKSGLQYAIGNLTTSNGNFRVSYYIKNSGGAEVIQQLRIDPED